MHDAAERSRQAVIDRDWAALRLLLHPYLQWRGADGVTVRGRTKVLAMLATQPDPPDPPSSVEMRDGQIYRWHSLSG